MQATNAATSIWCISIKSIWNVSACISGAEVYFEVPWASACATPVVPPCRTASHGVVHPLVSTTPSIMCSSHRPWGPASLPPLPRPPYLCRRVWVPGGLSRPQLRQLLLDRGLAPGAPGFGHALHRATTCVHVHGGQWTAFPVFELWCYTTRQLDPCTCDPLEHLVWTPRCGAIQHLPNRAVHTYSSIHHRGSALHLACMPPGKAPWV
jgi:hypothetical protein